MADKMRHIFVKFVLIVCVVCGLVCTTSNASNENTSLVLPQAINEKKQAVVKVIVYAVDQRSAPAVLRNDFTKHISLQRNKRSHFRERSSKQIIPYVGIIQIRYKGRRCHLPLSLSSQAPLLFN